MVAKPPGWLLDADPYEVQRVAFVQGSDRQKFGYWLDCGLGKSLALCADFCKQVFLDRIDGMIILAPSYLKGSWRAEWEKWQVPHQLITWPDRIPLKLLSQPHAIVLNYDSVMYSGGDYIEELLKSGRRYLVAADESRAIGNPSGKWNRRTMYYRTHAAQLRALCGMPWTNSVVELYPQLRWCGAISGWNPVAFKNRFARFGGYMGRKFIGVNNEEELQEIIASCGILAKKEDWSDLPEQIYPTPIEFQMLPEQLRMYREMFSEYAATFPDQSEDDEELVYASHAGVMLSKLQQITRGFVIDNAGDVRPIVSPDKNPAVRVLRHVIENTPGKILVFAVHRYSVSLLSEALRDFNAVTLHGGMKDTEIDVIKASFNEDNTVKAMVAQIAVGARGHTLLGTPSQRCSTTIYYENSFDLDLRAQSEHRNHRWGQDRAVVYHDFHCAPIDAKVVAALQSKGNLIRSVLDAVRATPK